MSQEMEVNFQVANYKTFRTRQKISLYEMAKNEARRFCSETGIHGFQFIAKSDNTTVERFVWTFISFGALLTALVLSSLSWVYSTTNPTYVATDSMQDPISNFMYPAVTICSLNKISKKLVSQFLNETLKVNNTSEWQNKMTLLAQMYFANYDSLESTGYIEFQHFLNKNGITAEEALLAVTPSCRDLLTSCMWKAEQIRCDRLFQLIRTPEGSCCSFNYYALKNWTFQGYMAERYKTSPRKLASCGHNSGVKVIVKDDPDDYMASEISAYGSKVIVHDPYAYPDWSAQRVLIPPTTQVYVDVNPSKTYATDYVKAMSLTTRKCVFKSERELKIFANYSYLNCLTECRIEIIASVCNCIPFYYQNEWIETFPPKRVCNLEDTYCMTANKHRFMSSVPGFDIYETKKSTHQWGSETNECNCIPDCELSSFIVHSTLGKLSIKTAANNKKFYGGMPNPKNFSVISVFFKGLTGTRTKRDVTLTWSSIFGLFGGLLGLCLGFTFITIVDVIYTFTLRLGININRKKNNMAKVKQMQHRSSGFRVLPLIDEVEKVEHRNLPKNNSFGNDIWFIN